MHAGPPRFAILLEALYVFLKIVAYMGQVLFTDSDQQILQALVF
jgi:hypothetical protein